MTNLAAFHQAFAWVAIGANALAGIAALVAWRRLERRGAWVWWATGTAEVMLLVQVLTGVALTSAGRYQAPRFHLFYGFVAFITVGLAYGYRASMRGRLEMFYGLIGLFLMGVGIRAVLQVR